MKETIISNEFTFLLQIEAPEWTPDQFISYFQKSRTDIGHKLGSYGAIKFKGVRIRSLQVFQEIVDAIAEKFLNYVDGNSPRTKLSGNVYTSTEYDMSAKITMHNELSYSAKWPGKLFFSCMKPAASMGETLLADSRVILKKMNQDIVSDIMHRGIIYYRNLHGGKGIGPSWQDTFETDDKEQVEGYCHSYGIRHEWKTNGGLRLCQPAKGIIKHRHNGEMVWFNQIDQFHPCHLEEEVYEGLLAVYDCPEDFPMYVTFGDGSLISEDMVREIILTTNEVTLAPAWQNDELLIVDNELVSHGRNPYTGQREVLVAMSE